MKINACIQTPKEAEYGQNNRSSRIISLLNLNTDKATESNDYRSPPTEPAAAVESASWQGRRRLWRHAPIKSFIAPTPAPASPSAAAPLAAAPSPSRCRPINRPNPFLSPPPPHHASFRERISDLRSAIGSSGEHAIGFMLACLHLSVAQRATRGDPCRRPTCH